MDIKNFTWDVQFKLPDNTIKEINHEHLYIVFGCTGSRDRVKRPIMMQLALNNSDFTYVTSDDLHEETYQEIVDDMLKDNKLNMPVS